MIFKDILLDIKYVQERDPSARNALEVFLLYQGIHALIWHRFAHWFYNHRMFFVARLISQIARFLTNIEIHPGATIGKGLIIDHGTGCVIGETTVIGDDCLLYHGVTLGGNGRGKCKRHPTLLNHVMVGCNSSILGNITLGNYVQIGANSVVTKDVEDHQVVYGLAAKVRPEKCTDADRPNIINVNRD